MRDVGPVLGVALGIAAIAANRWWPSWQLAWAGVACVLVSLLAGAALHPLSAFERARLTRSRTLSARAEAEAGYWRTIRSWAWEPFRRFWFFCALCILVSVFVLRLPAQGVWTVWFVISAAVLGAILSIATLNHIYVVCWGRLRDRRQ